MRDWKIGRGVTLTPYQLMCKNRPNAVKFIKRAVLDGTSFCSTEWSECKLTDNSFVMVEHKEQEQNEQKRRRKKEEVYSIKLFKLIRAQCV
jgi:hypothetical protein